MGKKTLIVKTVNKENADFQKVDYTSLNTGLNYDGKIERQFSIESIHQLQWSKPTNYWETLAHMVKGNVGCGVLGLGMAFKHGGLFLSIIVVITFSIASCYNQSILISLANRFKRKYNRKTISFSETIGLAYDTGPPYIKKLSPLVRKSINFFIIVTQMGSCSIYLLFISQSIDQVLKSYDIKINLRILMMFVLPIIWMTALIRQLKYIVPLSTLANISMFAGFVLILRSSIFDLSPISERKWIGKIEDLPLSFGTMIFALEGISLTLPLQQNMKKKKKFLGIFGVLNLSGIIQAVLMIVFGFFNYWKYGDNTKESLTLNLDLHDNLLSQIVIISMMIGILCTYALQFFIPVMLILPAVNKRTSGWRYYESHVYEYILRSIMVFFTFFVAMILPHFDLFLSFLGAIGGSFLAFIFCSSADLVSRAKTDRGKYYWHTISAIVSLLLGIFAFVVCTMITLREVIIALRHDLEMYMRGETE